MIVYPFPSSHIYNDFIQAFAFYITLSLRLYHWLWISILVCVEAYLSEGSRSKLDSTLWEVRGSAGASLGFVFWRFVYWLLEPWLARLRGGRSLACRATTTGKLLPLRNKRPVEIIKPELATGKNKGLFCSIPARAVFRKIPASYRNKSSSKRNDSYIGFIVLIPEQLLYSRKDL